MFIMCVFVRGSVEYNVTVIERGKSTFLPNTVEIQYNKVRYGGKFHLKA